MIKQNKQIIQNNNIQIHSHSQITTKNKQKKIA